MAICGRCGEEVSDPIKCTACLLSFDYACSGITEAGFRKLGDRQATWRCAGCKTTQKPSLGSQPAAVAAAVDAATTSLTLHDVMSEIHKISAQLAPLSTVVADIQAIKTDIAELKRSNSNTSKKLSQFEDRLKKVEASNDDGALKSRISNLEVELNEKDQWLRYNNVEIKGVPLKNNENLFEILQRIGTKVTYTVPKTSVNYITRVPSRGENASRQKSIIVSFTNRYTKEDFIAACRICKTITLDDIGFQGAGRVYVNDHLTVKNKILLNKTKAVAKEKNFQYVWVKHGKIHVRKTDSSPVLQVRTEEELSRLH
ncbi:uncharacterized protein LOC134665509 [Cydia fagiglandana]|uniref:uncharacterized protein LOC134665509 n=1 Tax=Cydia fagiglandana TaxID=1458189 RepID=UPI002FEE41D1